MTFEFDEWTLGDKSTFISPDIIDAFERPILGFLVYDLRPLNWLPSKQNLCEARVDQIIIPKTYSNSFQLHNENPCQSSNHD